MSVEVKDGSAVEDERSAIRPVRVRVEPDIVRTLPLREVRGVERHRRPTVHGNGERHGADVPAVVLVRAVVAEGVSRNDCEAVPALRHLHGRFRLAIVGVVVQHVPVVDVEGEVVVELLTDVPDARLVRRHLEPAVEAQLRMFQVLPLPT